jgi:prostaglandin-E synthase 1
MQPIDATTLRLFAGSTVALALLLVGLAVLTAVRRGGAKQYVNAEDSPVMPPGSELAEEDHPDVQKVQRAHRNAQENVFLFFTLGLVYVLTGASPKAALGLFPAFVLLRLLHAVFYVKGVQPARTGAFALGLVTMAVMCVMIVIAIV